MTSLPLANAPPHPSAALRLARELTRAFCVVQGEPGSGKSHLIRWLSVNWGREDDVKLLLQRADGSLEGALRQLQDALPPEFSELFKGLHQRHRAGERGRANLFLGNLASALDPRHFDPPLEDVDWCEANLPGELLFHRVVREEWSGPQRILNLIEGADHNRNSETASFNLFDIEGLARACREIRASGVPGKTEMLAQRLQAEAEVIREYREAGWSAEKAEPELKGRLKASAELMAALNRRRNDAIQRPIPQRRRRRSPSTRHRYHNRCRRRRLGCSSRSPLKSAAAHRGWWSCRCRWGR